MVRRQLSCSSDMFSQMAGIQSARSISTDSLAMQASCMETFDVEAARLKRSSACSVRRKNYELQKSWYAKDTIFSMTQGIYTLQRRTILAGVSLPIEGNVIRAH